MKTTIVAAMSAHPELIGYERAEAVGKELTDFMTEDSKTRYEQTAWPILRADGEIKEAEFQFVRKSGVVLDVLLSARVQKSGQGDELLAKYYKRAAWAKATA